MDFNGDGDFDDDATIITNTCSDEFGTGLAGVNELDYHWDFDRDGAITDLCITVDGLGATIVENRTVTTEGKPEWFDMGTYDMMNTCSSCHVGGGPFEGIVQTDGQVIPYDDPSLLKKHTADRDFYSYGPDTITANYYGTDVNGDRLSAGAAILDDALLPSDWVASGVMEADCMMCHIDPEHPNALMAADGIKADPNRPRMLIFAGEDETGEVNEISFGTPLANGLDNRTARPYTDALNRMSRPSPLNALAQLPAVTLGEMMGMWTGGLQMIEGSNGVIGLPYALYGDVVPKIWDAQGMLKAEYCANPYGPVAMDPTSPADYVPGAPMQEAYMMPHNMPYLADMMDDGLSNDSIWTDPQWSPVASSYNSTTPAPTAPYGEMIRMMENEGAIVNLFDAFLDYMNDNGMIPTTCTNGGADVSDASTWGGAWSVCITSAAANQDLADDEADAMALDPAYAGDDCNAQCEADLASYDGEIAMMKGMFFNDFVYGYQHFDKYEVFTSIPFGLRAYDAGQFYTDADDFQASVRDYVRQPLIEGEGIAYSGRVGLPAQMQNLAEALSACGSTAYESATHPMGIQMSALTELWQANGNLPATATPDIATDPMGMPTEAECLAAGVDADTAAKYGNLGGTPIKAVDEGVLHKTLPSFFGDMATAELMGLDLNGNGAPLTYIKMFKDDGTTNQGEVADSGPCKDEMVNEQWCSKTYYELDELTGINNLHDNMFGGVSDANSHKWTAVCGQCHVMLSDHDNSDVEMVRKYNLGMSADFVKNGHYVNKTTDVEAAGYDVHMSQNQMGCGSCHLVQEDYHGDTDFRFNKDLEAKHNFLKGTDTAHNVRNDLDNNIRPKNCEQCHIEDIDKDTHADAAAVAQAHEARFGEHAAVHMEKISCQACHIPYKKTWRFRAFDDTLGYYGNFDNRLGYDVLGSDGGYNKNPLLPSMFPDSNATFEIMAFRPEYAISPVYGASPGYGIPHFNMVAQKLDSVSTGQVPMDYVSQMVDYFHLSKEGDPGQMVNGLPTNPKFDFWKYFFQMFWKHDSDREGWIGDVFHDVDNSSPAELLRLNAPDQMTLPPLYYGNGTNGYPQIVTGNPITIMTWVDAAAGYDGENPFDTATPPNVVPETNPMSNTRYGGTKIVFLKEIMASVSEYYAPTNIGGMLALNYNAGTMTTPPGPINGWADIGPSGAIGETGTNYNALETHPGLGRVVLKDFVNGQTTGNIMGVGPGGTVSGYTLYDHTGDMYPEMWYKEDVAAVQQVLGAVLTAEKGHGVSMPRIFIAAHYFSDTHGVKPAEKALGSTDTTCFACHGYTAGANAAEDGAHRIEERVMNFLPWNPPWFTADNHFIPDHHSGDMYNIGGQFIIDHEVSYLDPNPDVREADLHTFTRAQMQYPDAAILASIATQTDASALHGGEQSVNGIDFIGATQWDILHRTEELANHFFYQNHGEEVLGGAIYGVNWNNMSVEETNRAYIPQVTNPRGNLSLKTRDWLPASIRKYVTAFGYVPVTQKINIQMANGSKQKADARVFRYGLDVDETSHGLSHDAHYHPGDEFQAVLVKLSQADNDRPEGFQYKPAVVFQSAHDFETDFDTAWRVLSDEEAEVVRYGNGNDNRYALRAGPGRYAAVHVLDMVEQSVLDCLGVPNGPNTMDTCGDCDADPYNDNTGCLVDCAGNVYTGAPSNVTDDCGQCVDVTGNEADPAADEDYNSSCVEDCDNVWGGNSKRDNCGVCDIFPGNDNTTCQPVCDATGGTAGQYASAADVTWLWPVDPATGVATANYVATNSLDNCNLCNTDANDDCYQDCNGDWGGTALMNHCGTCGDGVDPSPGTGTYQIPEEGSAWDTNVECVQTCDDQFKYLNQAEIDDAVAHATNVIVTENASTLFAGVEYTLPALPNGKYYARMNNPYFRHDAQLDDCSVCNIRESVAYNTSCSQDCLGEWDGTKDWDECGLCVDGIDNNTGCETDCWGTYPFLNQVDNLGLSGYPLPNPAFDGDASCTQDISGVIWQDASAGTTNTAGVEYTDASAHCASLTATLGGTWVLPTALQLEALVRAQAEAPHIIDILGDTTQGASSYWSSNAVGDVRDGVTFSHPTAYTSGVAGTNTATFDAAAAGDTLHVRCIQQ